MCWIKFLIIFSSSNRFCDESLGDIIESLSIISWVWYLFGRWITTWSTGKVRSICNTMIKNIILIIFDELQDEDSSPISDSLWFEMFGYRFTDDDSKPKIPIEDLLNFSSNKQLEKRSSQRRPQSPKSYSQSSIRRCDINEILLMYLGMHQSDWCLLPNRPPIIYVDNISSYQSLYDNVLPQRWR